MSYIPLDKCKHGYAYKIQSRNLAIGVFDSKLYGFIGIRRKFGDCYLFVEDHFDVGPPHGTVLPIEEIALCPVEDLQPNFMVCITCNNLLRYRVEDNVGKWRHLEQTDCLEAESHFTFGRSQENKPLYEYLKTLETQG